MLENLVLSVSTAIFLLCNLFVNSFGVSLAVKNTENLPSESIAAFADSSDEGIKSYIVGEWNSGGRIFEFTSGGRLRYNGMVMQYEITDDIMRVTYSTPTGERVCRLSCEKLGDGVISLGGVPMYRVTN